MKTTHIEIVRYRRTLLTDNRAQSSEEEQVTIDVTPEQFDMDSNWVKSFAVIEQKPTLISRLREFFSR